MLRRTLRRSTLVPLAPLTVAVLAAGCGRTETAVAVDTLDTESYGTFGNDETDTTTTTITETTETTTDDVMGFCGDGFADPDEECDFGAENGLPGSECTESCEWNFCGDFHLGPDEECDFGFENGQTGSECTADCQWNFCGDWHLGPGEECDFGFENGDPGSECTDECQFDDCGDFHLGPDEECDLGFQNGQPGSDCTDECLDNVCGDGHVGPFEECDFGDGNGNGAECKDDCQLNFCGDGYVGPGEGCDDGNDIDDDGCNNSCVLPSCGDGIQQVGEECDDGNDIETDACTSACTVAACGDGFTQPGNDEECDDGNGDDTDLCTSLCEDAVCGDGITQPANGETCDDGNDDETDACTSACEAPSCGDGFLQPDNGESCDDGDDIDGNGCNNDCNFSGQLVWERIVDAEAGSDAAHDVAIDSEGNPIVAGRLSIQTPTLHTEIWVRKYDPDGGTVWTEGAWGAVGNDYGYAVAVDPSDNVIVGGRITETVGGGNAWLRKYDAGGNPIWTETFAGPDGSTDKINGVATDTSGVVFVAGDSWASGESANYWVGQYLADGTPGWSDFYNGVDNSTDRAWDVFVDSGGNPLTTGESWELNEAQNIVVRRFTAAGGLDGSTTYDLQGSQDVGYCIAPTGDGGYVVSGTAWASGNGQNAWLRRFDANHQTVWTRTYNSSADNSTEQWDGCAVAPNGQIVVVGYAFLGADRDLFIRKYSADGDVLWTQFEGGPANGTDRYRAVAIDDDGFIYAVGNIDMGATGGDILVRKITP